MAVPGVADASITGRVTASGGYAGILAGDMPAATSSAAGSMSAADKTKLDGATDAATASALVQRATDGSAKLAVPLCSLGLTGLQSIANGVEQEVLWGVESSDVFAFHSLATATGRVTIPTGWSGKYRIYALLQYASNSTGLRGCEIYINGVFTNAQFATGFTGAGNPIAAELPAYPLNAGDYVQIFAYQTITGGGALNITNNSVFMVGWLSA